ncbi:unnamed protein product [Bursaphelenchus okinawaensis]|uniref:Uncharacterized protein n=1 Tax=Bursaphelenchus okinawaensis TaxID=465554 RepID=A0A811LNN7_9BILA|nr:unnamed protein product [Bursaphelenchus okinawaensis]CAG9126491.1 unnamed protein product [Bursaphelenchus okinawaensis]
MSRPLLFMLIVVMSLIAFINSAPVDMQDQLRPAMAKKSIYGLYQYIPKASGVKTKKFSSEPETLIGELPDGSYVILGY